MVDMSKRDMPYAYLRKAIEELQVRCDNKTIVEIGSMRSPCNHDLDKETCDACSDGHSTAMFARTNFHFITIDINPESVRCAREAVKGYPMSYSLQADGIEWLQTNMPNSIDLLFLDAWDLDLPESAEKHLEAFKAAERLLNDKSLVLVDDTDLDRINGEYFQTLQTVGGKGALLAPYMQEKGWHIVFNGRQTMWSK